MSILKSSRSIYVKSASLRFSPLRRQHGAIEEPGSLWKKTEERVRGIFALYDDVIGLREVRDMQKSVLEAESKFAIQQQLRRDTIGKLQAVHDKLKKVQTELERVQRSDERFLKLVTEEHTILKEEAELLNGLRQAEVGERDAFVHFSSQLRAAHESERQRGEKTKWMSLIGSVCGAAIGMAAATINNYYKHKALTGLISEQKREHEELKRTLTDCLHRVEPTQSPVVTLSSNPTAPNEAPTAGDSATSFETISPVCVDGNTMQLNRIERFLQIQAGVGLLIVLVSIVTKLNS